jgi:hypothetical protein
MIMSIMTNPRIQSIAAMRVDEAGLTASARLKGGETGGSFVAVVAV